MHILISGLPRAGKTSLADALASIDGDYTHVPLDRYILEWPEPMSFLEWVGSPRCIDWQLVEEHLLRLAKGEELVAPSPDWSPRVRRMSEVTTVARRRAMTPAARGYAIPGCYAFDFPMSPVPRYRVFISTPRSVLAERLIGRPVPESDAVNILDEHMSPNWRAIEAYGADADLVLSGVQPKHDQVRTLLDALESATGRARARGRLLETDKLD